MTTGWGAGGWGSSFWGVGSGPLRLLDAEPIRENVVRLTFNEPPLYTGLIDPNDASVPARYTIVIVPGSLHFGKDPRPVTAVLATLVVEAGSGGRKLDVTVDRPFSPWPARYTISVNQLQTHLGGLLDPAAVSISFDGLLGERGIASRDKASPTRDIANPQTLESLLNRGSPNADLLGSFPIDETGDYAFDQGVISLKKRCYRRIITRRGGFSHMPEYGIGLLDHLKRLGTLAKRTEIASEIEKQILQEPDVEAVSARLVTDERNPSIYRVRLRIRTKVSGDATDFDFPFAPIA